MLPLPADSFVRELEMLKRANGRRWRSDDGLRLYEWDGFHGHLEGYTRRGVHVGSFDPITGIKISDPVKGRRIDV